MKRRTFLSALTGRLLAAPLAAGAQPERKVPTIDLISGGTYGWAFWR